MIGMRTFAVLVLAAPTAGCAGINWYESPGVLAGFNLAAIPVIHRTMFDAIYAAVTGRDCSVVRLDDGESYCRPIEPPPQPPAYCTRSLANVDCWQNPAALPRPAAPLVADGPTTLTPAQEADRTRRWPNL